MPEFDGQFTHAVDEKAFDLYVLAAHAVMPDPCPVEPACPALAKHPLSAAVPVPLPVPEFGGQFTHAVDDKACDLNVLAAHAVMPDP